MATKAFVEQLRDLAKEVADQQNKCPDQVFSTVYAMVGSVSYYRLSAGALVAMFGPETYGDMEARFKVDLRHRLEEVSERLPLSVGNAALGEVIRGQFDPNLVTG